MMMSYIIPPLVGGVIGYITNDIAIRMLFRPHTTKYVFGVRVPFTPGIIPKEKERIAESIGGTISQNLMNHEVLEHYLLSDEMILKVRDAVEGFFNEQKKNPESVSDFLRHYLSKEEIQGITSSINASLTNQIHSKLSDTEVGKNVAHVVVDNVVDKMKSMDPTEVLSGIAGGFGGIKGAAAMMFGTGILSKFFSLLREPAENILANNINNMLQKNGVEIVSTMIGAESQALMNKPIHKLLEGKDEQIAQIVNSVESIYRTILSDYLPRILDTVDISKIVRERINEMDVDETERLIFNIMSKELKAIVWLGAGLGLIMGFVNCLI